MAKAAVRCALSVALLPYAAAQHLRGGSNGTASAATFQCLTSLNLGPVADASRKGLALDDTTLQNCSGAIPRHFPNTNEPVQSLRLFKAWDPEWPDEQRLPAWQNLATYVKTNNVRVLLGTSITCNETLDAQSWVWARELAKMLGPSRIMGLAIGNELEILYKMGDRYKLAPVTPQCIDRMWKGRYFADTFKRTVAEFDAMGFESVPVTSVFGGFALAGEPFVDLPEARVQPFLREAVQQYGRRYVFTFNFYPYFDTNMHLDLGSNSCNGALGGTTCWKDTCFMPIITKVARQRVAQMAPGSVMWLGETGWSSPFAPSLESQMARCSAWSDEATLRAFYTNFLHWNLADVEHVFYFTVRDSKVFGVPEYFGLLSTCEVPRCKLEEGVAASSVPDAGEDTTPPPASGPEHAADGQAGGETANGTAAAGDEALPGANATAPDATPAVETPAQKMLSSARGRHA